VLGTGPHTSYFIISDKQSMNFDPGLLHNLIVTV